MAEEVCGLPGEAQVVAVGRLLNLRPRPPRQTRADVATLPLEKAVLGQLRLPRMHALSGDTELERQPVRRRPEPAPVPGCKLRQQLPEADRPLAQCPRRPASLARSAQRPGVLIEGDADAIGVLRSEGRPERPADRPAPFPYPDARAPDAWHRGHDIGWRLGYKRARSSLFSCSVLDPGSACPPTGVFRVWPRVIGVSQAGRFLFVFNDPP